MVVLYTAIYLMALHMINYLFVFDWSSAIAIGCISLFYVFQMLVYIRKNEWLEMQVSASRPVTEELPSIVLNEAPYKVLPSSVLLPHYIMLELHKEGSEPSSFFSRIRSKKQLMIFPDQCKREEFHTLIRLIRLAFGQR